MVMYIHRHAERTVTELASMFGAVLVAGPRQVGKTTMLDRLTENYSKVTLDDPIVFGGGPCSYNPEPIAEFFDVFYCFKSCYLPRVLI